MTTPRDDAKDRLAFHEAIDQQDVWKAPEMRAFAVALVRAAVEKLKNGQLHFSTDDVPEDQHPESSGVAGSVIEKLKNAHVIEPVGRMIDGQWYPERVRSARASRKGAWICKYQLCSLANGSEFLRRNAVAIFGQQQQLDLTAV
jgi:hypothetical protein